MLFSVKAQQRRGQAQAQNEGRQKFRCQGWSPLPGLGNRLGRQGNYGKAF